MMKNSGAKSEESGGRMFDRALLESLRQFIAARFAPLHGRSKTIVRTPYALACSLAFSRGFNKKHDLSSVNRTLGFLDSLVHGPLTEELPGFGASMVYKEPGRSLHQSFYTWFVESVLSLTVNKLEQSFGIWLNQVYAVQTHSNLEHQSLPERRSYPERRFYPGYQSYLEHRSYLEHKFYAEYRSYLDRVYVLQTHSNLEHHSDLERRFYPGHQYYLERQSYMERQTRLASGHRARAVGREVFLSQPAPNRGASPEPGTVSHIVERSLREVYAKDTRQPYAKYSGRSYTQVFNLPSRQTVQLWMRTHLVTALRAFESRMKVGSKSAAGIRAERSHAHAVTRADKSGRESAITVLSIAASSSRVFVAPQQNSTRAVSAPTQPRRTLSDKYGRGVTQWWRADSLELTAQPLSARGLAEKIKEVYVVWPPGGSTAAAASRKSTAVAVASGVIADRLASSGMKDRVVSGGVTDGAVSVGATEFVSRSPGEIPDVARQPPASLHHVRPARIVMDESARRRLVNVEAFSRVPIALARIVDWFERKREAELSPAKVESSRVGPTGGVLLKTRRGGELTGVKQDISAPPSNRASAAGTTLNVGTALTVGTMFTAATVAYRSITEGRSDSAIGSASAIGSGSTIDGASAIGGFTFLRREEQMRPPPQSFAFAQPVRPALVEERVVSHVREREVAEVVRKEVATVMKSRSPVDGLSRADYSRIADHVYSSLARRLLIEKERSRLQR